MNIAVLIKQVVDVTFQFDLHPETNVPRAEDLFYMVNPADLSACEWALQINETWGGEATFISFGPARARQALVSILAMGGGRAIHVWDDGLEVSSLTAARILAEVVRPLACDLILCGTYSLDERSGELPPALAELLDLPQVTGAMAIEIVTGGRQAIVERKTERGRRQTIACQLPAVLAIDPEMVVPRYAPLPSLLKAHAGEHMVPVDWRTLGIDPSQIAHSHEQSRPVGLSLPRPRPKKTFTIDRSLSADERMDLIMSGGLTRRSKSEFLEGNPLEIAEQMSKILLRKEIIG